MLLTPKAEKVFELAPEGLYDTVLIDVVDIGMVTSTFNGQTKTQPKIMLVFQAAETDKEGNPFRFFKRYTASLHCKSNLFAAIKKLTGKEPVEAFELDSLLGVNAKLDIEHEKNANTGKTYSVIASIIRSKTKALKIPKDFVRKQDQPKDAKGTLTNSGNGVPQSTLSTLIAHTDSESQEQPAYEASDSGVAF